MIKLVTKYETYKQKEGIHPEGESMTDKSMAEEADIYKCIEKYGITTMMRQSEAKEPLYLDNTQNMNLAEAVRMREQMDEYFANLPARVRKVFGDNSEIFYQKYKAGEFREMLDTGVMTIEQINAIRMAGGEDEVKFENYTSTNNSSTGINQNNMGNIQNTGGSILDRQSGTTGENP